MNIIWSKPNCSYCFKAKRLLNQYNIRYEEKVIGEQYSRDDLLAILPNVKTVPQIFMNGVHIGGYEELVIYLERQDNE